MKSSVKPNQCVVCGNTHEECRDSKCSKASISEYVCRVFGIPPVPKRRRKH